MTHAKWSGTSIPRVEKLNLVFGVTLVFGAILIAAAIGMPPEPSPIPDP